MFGVYNWAGVIIFVGVMRGKGKERMQFVERRQILSRGAMGCVVKQ